MLQWQKENTINYEQAQSLFDDELKGKIVMGLLYHNNRPEYCRQYQDLVDGCRKED